MRAHASTRLSYTSASKRTPDRRDPDDQIPPNTRQIHGSHTRIQHAPLLEQPWRAQQGWCRRGWFRVHCKVTQLRVRVLMYLSRARATELSRLDGIPTPRPLPSV